MVAPSSGSHGGSSGGGAHSGTSHGGGSAHSGSAPSGSGGGHGQAGQGSTAPTSAPNAAAFHEVRFRGRTRDGREVVSHPTRLTPTPAGGAGSVQLGQAHWGHASYRSGQTANLSVPVRGQASSVRFVIEKNEGGRWVPVAEVPAEVTDGVAHGRWAVPALPLQADPNIPPDNSAETGGGGHSGGGGGPSGGGSGHSGGSGGHSGGSGGR